MGLLLLALSEPGRGHDFWIETTSFHPALSVPVPVYLLVGENFVGEQVPRLADRIERFVVFHEGREEAIAGSEGSTPAGMLSPAVPGAHWLVYQSRPGRVDLEMKTFRAHLLAEGLEAVVAERERRGESDMPGREIYVRCAKALLCADDEGSSDKVVAGLPVEILAEIDLCRAPAGKPLSFSVVSRGGPVRGTLVVALHRDDPTVYIAARTDDEGRVRLVPDRPGVWLVKTVHMVRAEPEADVEWKSYWASLTFELSPESAPAP